MAHNLSFDLEEERRGITARLKAAMESIIHKYQDVDEEEGDFVTLDNLDICVDKGQLRHQEAAHFGFLQAALPEDSATPHASHDDRELVRYPELDDEQPTLGVMMLRDFGNRMEQSICMRSKKSDDGKVYWEPEDDVEEDMLTIGDDDSDRCDISSDEDKWAETDARRRSTVELNEESPGDSRGSAENDEYDAWRRSPLEQNEESPEDSRGSESEENLSDSSGISYRNTQNSITSTDSINQNHRRDKDYKQKTRTVHNGRESMDTSTNRYNHNASTRKGIYKHNKPTNKSTNGSNQDHKRTEKSMPVHNCKSKESMEMPADRYRDKGSHRMSVDKYNKRTNISANGSISLAGESEDELSGSSGFSYEEAHKSKTATDASSNDHKKGNGYEEKTLPFDRSRKSVEMPASKCKDTSSHRKTVASKHNKLKIGPDFLSLFPESRRKKTPSKSAQNRDEHKGFGTDIKPKIQPASTPVADCSKLNSTPAKSHFHSVKKEELSNSTKKRQSYTNVCIVEELDDMYSESLPSSSRKNRKDSSRPKVGSPCSSNSGHGTPISGKSEKHMKKIDRKRSDRDVIDLLTEPDEQSEMGNVTPVHHRSFSNAEKPDQGAGRRKCFSVPAKRRIMALTSSRDTDINSSSLAASPKVHLLTHEDICDLLGEQPSTTHQGMKQRVKYKYVPSASMALQSVEEYGDNHKGKSDTGLGKQQDCSKEVQLSSKDIGTKVTSTASTLNMVKKVSISKPCSTKEKLVVEPFKQRLHQSGSSQDESLTDSNSSFHSLSDEYPPYQREGSGNMAALQPSTSYSEDENCRPKPDHSIELDHSDSSHTYSPHFSVENSIKHVEEQLPSVKSLKSSQGALMTPLTPILKTPGQRSATPCREKTQKKRVYFSADPTNVEEQCMQDTLQFWKSRMQQSKINHDDSEVDLPSPEPHQEDQQRQETSEQILEEPAFFLLSVGDELSHLHKSAAIQTSTPRRDADKPRFSTPKGRKIPQEDEAPSPCTLMRNQLDNIKLGSPIHKGPSTKQDVLNNQSPEKMEVDESPKCSTDWTKQFANRERRKMVYGLTERKRDRESQILRVNTSNSSFSDAAAFSQSSASSGEKDDQTGSNILTRRSSRLNSTNVVAAPKTDPRHNKKGTENRPFDVIRRLNRSEVLDVQTSEINSDKGRARLFKQPESPYILRPRRAISSSDDQDVKNSPRKTSSRQNTRHTTAKGRQTERLSRSVEKRKTDKFLLTPSQARAVDRQRKDTRQWGWRHSSFSSEAETTSSTQQVSSPEVGERRVTRSQSSSDMDTVEWKMTRGQMWPDTRGKKVTKRNGQSVTVGKTPGSAVNQSKGPGRRRIIDISSSDEEVRSTPRKASSTQGIKYKKGKGRLTREGD
ncbi:uncharacterized protein LOC144912279 [Branchiostoma floridae x Branchiostoma belcheri]